MRNLLGTTAAIVATALVTGCGSTDSPPAATPPPPAAAPTVQFPSENSDPALAPSRRQLYVDQVRVWHAMAADHSPRLDALDDAGQLQIAEHICDEITHGKGRPDIEAEFANDGSSAKEADVYINEATMFVCRN